MIIAEILEATPRAWGKKGSSPSLNTDVQPGQEKDK